MLCSRIKTHLFVLIAIAGGFVHCIAAQTNAIFTISNSWRYAQGTNLNAVNWKSSAYNDAAWPSGQGLLAYETCGCLPQTILTTLTTNTSWLTFYFRTHFNFVGNTNGVSLLFSNLIDDGAVFYLNGTEIRRVGMPGGAITYGTLASRTVNNATSYDVFIVPATNLISGDNVLAVEVHQILPASTDVVFGSALSAVAGGIVTRGPYLQLGTPTSVVVRWRTDVNTDSRVRFGTNLASLTSFADNLTVTNEHVVTVTNLLPDTKYFYTIGSTTVILAGTDTNQFFVTPPLPGTPKPTRIWVLGDSGTANTEQVAVRDAYYGFTGSRHTDLWLMLGDNAYESGMDSEYQAAVFDVYQTMLRKSVLWPTLGNHDTAGSTDEVDTYPYFDIFTLPKNGQAGGAVSGTEHYYSFDYGNIHFICLDSMTASRAADGAMAQWLIDDLGTVTANWIIAYWHHPPYSKGSHNSDAETELIQLRQNFLPILEAGGVDLVLAGHSHSYERSYLLDGHYGTSGTLTPAMKLNAGNGRTNGTGAYLKASGTTMAHQGAVYAVAGSSSHVSGGLLNHPAMFISLNNLGSLVLDISGNRLDAKFLRETGIAVDYFTILKTNTPPVANNLAVNVIGDSSTDLVLSADDTNGNTLTFQTTSVPTNGLVSNFNPVAGSLTYTPARNYRGQDAFAFRANDGATNSNIASVSLNVIAPADTNANGLPDDWETAYGISDPDADADGDGMNNSSEYSAGTNPTNANSSLSIISATLDENGHFSMMWSAIGGTRYRVGFSDEKASGNWLFTDIVQSLQAEMNSSPAGVPSEQGFTDNFTLTGGWPTNGARYYRVRVAQ